MTVKFVHGQPGNPIYQLNKRKDHNKNQCLKASICMLISHPTGKNKNPTLRWLNKYIVHITREREGRNIKEKIEIMYI